MPQLAMGERNRVAAGRKSPNGARNGFHIQMESHFGLQNKVHGSDMSTTSVAEGAMTMNPPTRFRISRLAGKH